MKKLLSVAIVAGMMSTSAMALEGTVVSIMVNATIVKIGIQLKGTTDIVSKKVDPSSDLGKVMIASAMTAKVQENNIEAYHDGTNWNYFNSK